MCVKIYGIGGWTVFIDSYFSMKNDGRFRADCRVVSRNGRGAQEA